METAMHLRQHLFGHYEDLTPEQMAKTEELLEATAHLPCPPSYAAWRESKPTLFMAKFLYARKWSVPDAKDMYMRSSSWRLYHKIETEPMFPAARPVRGYDTELLMQIQGGGRRSTDAAIDVSAAAVGDVSFMGWHKWDKEGHPVFIERMGLGHASEIADRYHMLARPEEKFTKRFIDLDRHTNEVGGVLVDHNNRYVVKDPTRFISQVTVILDAKGIGLQHFAQASMELMKDSTDVATAYYPEGLHKIFIANSLPIINIGWAMVKPWLDKRIQAKIVFLKEGAETADVLREHIDVDKLPAFLGGECRCPGGCVPSPGDGAVDRWSAMDKTFLTHSTHVSPGGTADASCLIGAAHVPFRWSMTVDSHDVDYVVDAVSSDGAKRQRLQSGDKARFGFGTVKPLPADFKCAEATPCKVEFHFNNRYSWVTGKTIRHRVEPLATYEADLEREAAAVDPQHSLWM